MTYVLDGGKACTQRRRFIASPVPETDGHLHHENPEESLQSAVSTFIGIHKNFAKQDFRPTRDDLGYMAESA